MHAGVGVASYARAVGWGNRQIAAVGVAGALVVLLVVTAAGMVTESGDGEHTTSLTPEATSPSPTACRAGPVEVDGMSGQRFCGRATAELIVGTRTLELAGGACKAGDGSWAANLGTLFPAAAAPPDGEEYVGATIGSPGSGALIADGVYPDALLTWSSDAGVGQATGTITLQSDLDTALFEGDALTGESVLGTIHC
jgi:hypothetical protein